LLWLLLLALAQGPAVRADHDLDAYLAVVARYGSGERIPALREIRTWRSVEVEAALAALRHDEDRLRAVPVATGDVDFRRVESAVLLHAEAGLLFLQAQSTVDAEWQLRTATSLYEWSRDAARRMHLRAARPRVPQVSPSVPPEPLPPALLVRERIDPREFYLALAATSLAFGYAPTARELAERAGRAAPPDAQVHLVLACAIECQADEQAFRSDDAGAARLRREAEAALRTSIHLDPGLTEARLRLGHILLVEGRLAEAEPLLADAEGQAPEGRARYLARLFLGRAAERKGRRGDAAAFYRRALEAWPDGQTALLALAHALEHEAGPAAARALVAASLAASRREDRVPDPWWVYPFGPAGLPTAALDRVWTRGLER
jgi:hypothetical protein